VLCRPAGDAPVAEGDFEVDKLRIIGLAVVIVAERSGFDRSVPLLGSVLLWNGDAGKVTPFRMVDKGTVLELDEDVVRFNVSTSQNLSNTQV
jgi:hypothetical protein